MNTYKVDYNDVCSYCGESHPQHGAICPVWEQHQLEDAQEEKEANQKDTNQ